MCPRSSAAAAPPATTTTATRRSTTRCNTPKLLDLTNPRAANALWETVDRQLTNNAEWVTTVDTREVELTSSHLQNYEYNPV
jgi:hypothetical protein